MLALISLAIALWLSSWVNDRFLEHDSFTPGRGALLLGALVVGPLYALSPWLAPLTLPYVVVLYITMPEDKNYAPTRKCKSLSRSLPGRPTRIPYFGHAFQLASLTPKNVISFIEEMTEEFPRLFSLRALGTHWIYLNTPEDLEVLLGSVKYIVKGPQYTMLAPWLREGLLISSGEKWRTRRKLFTPTFHFKILENNIESLNKNSRLLLSKLLATNGQALEIDKYIRLCTLDIITETAMGISLEAQGNQNSDYIEAINKVSEISILRMLNFWLFKPEIFFCTSAGQIFKGALRKLHAFSEKIIRERKLSYSKRELKDPVASNKNSNPFLDCLIEMDLQNPNSLTNLDIQEEVDTFMFEGHDTTSSALVFSLLLLGNHPEIQEIAFQEQLEIFGDSDRHVTMPDLKSMTYLEQVIKEVLRLYPSVPMMTRFLQEEMTLPDNIVIPERSVVLFCPFLTHRDPKHFPEPELFDPERFSPLNVKERHPFAYIPFSAGPRNCIGQKFAMMEIKTVLSTILRFSRIEAVTKTDEVKPLAQLILKPDKPILISAHRREMTI